MTLPDKKIRRYLKPAAGFCLIGAILFACSFLDLPSHVRLSEVRTWIDEAGALGPFAFIGICIAGVILHLPEIVLIAIGGVLFGGVKGFLYGWAGAIIGSACTFLFVRYFLRDAFQNNIAGRFKYLKSINGLLEARGFQTVLILRLVLFMAPPLNWLIAVTRVHFLHYLAGSMLGIIPGVAITCYAADSIVQIKSVADLLTLEFAVPTVLFLLLIASSGTAAWRLFRKDPQSQET